METLTNNEIDILLEALKEWEQKKDGGSRLFGSMLSAMLLKDEPIDKKLEREEKEKQEELKERQERQQREELSTMLKAKLIGIKQLNSVNSALKS